MSRFLYRLGIGAVRRRRLPRWLDRTLPHLDIEGEHLLPEAQYEIGHQIAPHATEHLVGV